jgi:IstB-like ATP binding protein
MSAKAAPVAAARVELLRLPAIALAWPDLAATTDREGWPAARFLAALAEVEVAERDRRRFERHLAEARLPSGKTLDNFDFAAVPMISKARVLALAEGDSWLAAATNLLYFGPPGSGTSHSAAPSDAPSSKRDGACFTLDRDGWDQIQLEKLCRREAAMAGENRSVLVDQDQVPKPDRLNELGDLPDLRLRMRARIAWICDQRTQRPHAQGFGRFPTDCAHPNVSSRAAPKLLQTVGLNGPGRLAQIQK